MKEILIKLSKSEVRDRKKRFKKIHPCDDQNKKSELFCKSFFGKRNLNKK